MVEIDNNCIDHFAKQASQCKLLTKVEERELLGKVKAGDVRAKNKLMHHNLRLVISIAKKYMGQGLDFQDCIQEGQLGLEKAITKFDLNKTVNGRPLALSTYATWWIRQSITRSYR